MKRYLLIIALFSANLFAQSNPSYYDEGLTVNIVDPIHQSDIYGWCDFRLRLLNEVQNTARDMAFRQDYQGATEFILLKLKELKKTEFTPYQPLSQTVVKRGIILGESLLKTSFGDNTAVKATTYFLDKYIDYIKHVITQVDRPYYRNPQCGHCGYPDQRTYETDLIEIARMNLEVVNDTLIHLGARVSLGPSKLYFKAAEILTYYSATDLSSSLFANLYTCQIKELFSIHNELRFNTDLTQYKVKIIFNKVEFAIEKLLRKRNCH